MSIRINMKLIKPIILIFFYLLFFPVFNNAQKIVKLGIVDGLSNENTISFTQDRDGFIWIGTKDGLNRFDSETFQVYKTSETEPNSICGPLLIAKRVVIFGPEHDLKLLIFLC